MTTQEEVAEQVSKKKFDAILHDLKKDIDNASKKHYRITVNIPPDNIEHYQELQQAISVLIPDEYKRPTIELDIVGSASALDTKPTLALLGGTGPLSDANFITELVHKAEKKNEVDQLVLVDQLRIKLLSMPPPRPEKEDRTAYLPHLYRYLKKAKKFGGSGANHYAMLSNTAHANADDFTILLDKKDNFVHLVDGISAGVVNGKPPPTTVLILGTAEAKRKKVYPKAIKKQNKLNKKDAKTAFPSKKRQKKLQYYIDGVKQNTITSKEKKSFVKFIFREIRKLKAANIKNPSHVIFSCTEIPLFLHMKIDPPDPKFPDAKTYGELLDDMLKNDTTKDYPITLVDSEEEMVNSLYEKHLLVPLDMESSLNSLDKAYDEDVKVLKLKENNRDPVTEDSLAKSREHLADMQTNCEKLKALIKHMKDKKDPLEDEACLLLRKMNFLCNRYDTKITVQAKVLSRENQQKEPEIDPQHPPIPRRVLK